ncbi:MAG: NUDIX hydrolase [Bdellovibrionia bacterium]
MSSFEFPSEFEARLKQALSLDLPYSERLLREPENTAAVLAVFARRAQAEEGNPTGLSLLVTRRTDTLQSHQGQMAFPGGRAEPEELAQDNLALTALRETEEEVGLSRHLVRVVGALPELITVTNYKVTPFVGILEAPLEEVVLIPAPDEVAEAIWVPWSVLTHASTYQKEMIRRGDIQFPTHVYTVDGRRIWGATGAMIKNLLDRFEQIG